MTPTSIGIFVGSTTSSTEFMGEAIQEQLNLLLDDEIADYYNILDTKLEKANEYEFLIFGIPTYDFGELQEDWEKHWGDLDKLDLEGKVVAIFGLGDQLGYSEWFLDAMRTLYDALKPKGCRFIGEWLDKGYSHKSTKALNKAGTHFVGLAHDDENQFELREQRAKEWAQQLLTELAEIRAL